MRPSHRITRPRAVGRRPPTQGNEDSRAHRALARRVARQLRRLYGNPEQRPADPVDVLLQTVLSQKTTSESCRAAFDALKTAAGSWDRARRMRPATVARLIRPAGLADQKAPRLLAILDRLHRDHGRVSLDSLIPRSDAEAETYLISLPGVGPKTAKCVLLFALERSVLPVDTHISRLSRRLGLVDLAFPELKIHDYLARVVAPADRFSFHVLGFRHGRTVCLARSPRCGDCCLRSLCPRKGVSEAGVPNASGNP